MDLVNKLKNSGKCLCINLDPDLTKIGNKTQFEFNKEIIDQTAELVGFYKPNSAFYEAGGAEGVSQLRQTCDYITQNHPEIGLILDAKRGDIGNTNNGYAQFAFDYLGADGLTVAPYMGGESLEAFTNHKDKYFFVLARTSNPGGGEFQDLETNGKPLYQTVAENAVSWGENVSLVAGATYPEELKTLKQIAGARHLLIPGIGHQGGSVAEVLANAGKDNIICVGRSIIYAENPRTETEKLVQEINNG